MSVFTHLLLAGLFMLAAGTFIEYAELGFAPELGLSLLATIVYVVAIAPVEEDATKWRNLKRGRIMAPRITRKDGRP